MPGAPAPGLSTKPGGLPEPALSRAQVNIDSQAIDKSKRKIRHGKWVHARLNVMPSPGETKEITESCEIVRTADNKYFCLKPPPCGRTSSIIWGVVAEIISRALTANDSGDREAKYATENVKETKKAGEQIKQALINPLEEAVEVPQLENKEKLPIYRYADFILKIEIVPGSQQEAFEKTQLSPSSAINPLPFGNKYPFIVLHRPWITNQGSNKFESAIDCEWRGIPLALVPKLASQTESSFERVAGFAATNRTLVEAAKDYMSRVPDRIFCNPLHPVAHNGRKRQFEVDRDIKEASTEDRSYTQNCHFDQSLQEAYVQQSKWNQPFVLYLNTNYTKPEMFGRKIEFNGVSRTSGRVGWAIKRSIKELK